MTTNPHAAIDARLASIGRTLERNVNPTPIARAVRQMFPQSPSSISTFHTCARQFEAKYVTKSLPYRETEQQAYGNRLHKASETYLLFRQFDGKAMEAEFGHLKPILDQMLEMASGWKLGVEQSLSITEDGKETTWKQRWFGLRADITMLSGDDTKARVFDWKTGKIREDYDQLEYTAGVLMMHKEKLQTVNCGYLYTAHDHVAKVKFTRDQLPAIQAKIKHNIEAIRVAIETNSFPPNPSGLCARHCDVVTCEFHGKRNR